MDQTINRSPRSCCGNHRSSQVISGSLFPKQTGGNGGLQWALTQERADPLLTCPALGRQLSDPENQNTQGSPDSRAIEVVPQNGAKGLLMNSLV